MPRPKLITVSEALKLAREYGVTLSRPTIIKHAYKYDYGYQIGGKGGKWIIHHEKFRRWLRGENKPTKHQKPDTADREPRQETQTTVAGPGGVNTGSDSFHSV